MAGCVPVYDSQGTPFVVELDDAERRELPPSVRADVVATIPMTPTVQAPGRGRWRRRLLIEAEPIAVYRLAADQGVLETIHDGRPLFVFLTGADMERWLELAAAEAETAALEGPKPEPGRPRRNAERDAQIVAAAGAGEKQVSIARKFGVSKEAVRQVLRRARERDGK